MMIAFGRLYGITRQSAHKRRVRAQACRPPSMVERKRVPADARRNIRRRRG
jgi:hypothetical protein